jgi:ADP-ribose pyrophosphatase YjhB (NUDIX family)
MKEKLKKLPAQIAVRAIIVNSRQEVMLIKRALETFEGGKWCLVGGKPNEKEDLNKAITRETKEEVGAELALSHYAEVKNPDTSTGVRWITHYFVGQTETIPDQLQVSEVSEAAFFSQAELDSLDITFDHREILALFYASKQQ